MKVKFNDLPTSDLIQGAIYEDGGFNNPMKDDPLSKIFKLNGFQRGIGNQGGFRKTRKEQNGKVLNGTLAFVVMVDSKKQSEWPNEYDEELGIFKYYGDNRTPGNDIFETKNLGNEFLFDIFTKSYKGPEERATIPPIFLFSSIGKGCHKKFIGIAVPNINAEKLEDSLERKVTKHKDGDFENFLAHFTILDTSKEVISRKWLKDLKSTDFTISENAPQAWIEFVMNKSNKKVIGSKTEEVEITQEVDKSLENEVRRNIKVRVTQGKFRDDLLDRDKNCLLCGLDMPSLLIASHIKPWSESLDHERVDSNNGLLLCSIHDALFDKGYITFKDTGKIVISDKVKKENYRKLNINNSLYIKLDSKNQDTYLDFHRNNIFKI